MARLLIQDQDSLITARFSVWSSHQCRASIGKYYRALHPVSDRLIDDCLIASFYSEKQDDHQLELM